MLSLFSRLKIGHRVLLALLLPAFGFVAASLTVISDRRATVNQMTQLGDLVGVSTQISALVHELQKERGTSAVFLGSRGTQMVQELPEQHKSTNGALATLDQTLRGPEVARAGGNVGAILREAMGRLAELDAVRRKINSLDVPVPEATAYFTGTILRLLDVGQEIATLVHNAGVAKPLAAYLSFMQAKERAGQERGIGAPAFATDKFAPAQHRQYLNALSEYETYSRFFRSYATPAQADFVAKTIVGEAVREVERLRKTAVETAPGESLGAVQGSHWYRMATERIDLMKKVEDRLAEDVMAAARQARGAAESEFMLAVAIGLVLLAVTGVVGTLIVRSITRPVKAMTSAMNRLADGDTSTEVPARARRDEIGAMAQAVQVFKTNMIETERLKVEQEAMKRRAEEEKKAAMNAMADAFEASVKGVVQTVSAAATQMQSSAQSLSATAEETSRQSTAVAAASEQASTNVQTVAAAAEQLTASIAEISQQVGQSAQIAGKAVDEAAKTNVTVHGLAEAAQKIGEVVKLINDIAGQTNLLALNATIEAARAGEAGKGFAVVASEVKSLANQTAKATEEISAQISAIQGATTQSVEAIKGIGTTIAEINEIATTIASAVEQQGAATQEIARNVQQASAGTNEVSQNIAGVTQASGETGAAATQMLSAAGELAKQSALLSSEVDKFVATIRAA